MSDPDAQPTSKAFWKDAKVIWPQSKLLTSFRIDPDVLAWFKAQGKGYQTRMNAVLRAYVKAQTR
ncbi:MAG TPA: BrnA antitoxin family protein [Rhizomicrobium sp.]|nr:BrnA antitoxin family protein [Rhizomicrobium sp.]